MVPRVIVKASEPSKKHYKSAAEFSCPGRTF